MKKKLAIVDDHILIANALSSIISNFNQFEVVFLCENGKDLQEKIKTLNIVPDVILLDINMPIMNGFETTKWIKENHHETLIMALSMQDDDKSLIKMIKNGANGYMLKNVHPLELQRGLINLITNGNFFPDWAASKVFNSIGANNENTELKIVISEREAEFLKYTTTEMNYREISEKMFCSPRTVENYRDSLFEKLELKTRVGLAVYALKHGFEEA